MICPNASIWRPSCKRRTCPACGVRWVKNWLTVMRVNLEHFGRPVTTIAITAPGKDVLPWDTSRCTHGAGAKCSGTRHGCRVQDRAVREWADTLTLRWGWLRRAARQSSHRAGAPVLLLERVFEPQKRGAPHLHVVVPYGTPAERQAAQFFANELARLAPRYGFGYVTTKLRGQTGAEAASYLTSYFLGGSRKKPSIKDTVKSELLPRSLIWLTATLTCETFVTMRLLRRARHLWARSKGLCDGPIWSSMVEAVKTGVVYRRAYRRDSEDDEDDLASLFEVALYVDVKTAEQPLLDQWDIDFRNDATEYGNKLAARAAGLDLSPGLLAAAA